MSEFFTVVAEIFEVIGVGVMIIGFVVASALGLRSWIVSKNGKTAFTTLRDSLGLVILLGLEVLVAADLVRTVTSTPSLTDALVLGIVVIIRTILSFSLQIEIEGVVPWKRAMLTAPQQIAALAARSRRPARSDQSPSGHNPDHNPSGHKPEKQEQ